TTGPCPPTRWASFRTPATTSCRRADGGAAGHLGRQRLERSRAQGRGPGLALTRRPAEATRISRSDTSTGAVVSGSPSSSATVERPSGSTRSTCEPAETARTPFLALVAPTGGALV